jgi:hypothetical protein
LNGDTISLNTSHIVLDAPVTISTNPANNIWIHGITSPRIFHVNSGVTATISGLHLIAGTSTDGGAIRNAGTLTIDDLQVKKHAGINTAKLIKSTGMLMIEGNCMVQ